MMKACLLAAMLLLTPMPGLASVDGEVAWTKLSFCNGAGYCVDIASAKGVGIDLLRIAHDGKEIDIPDDIGESVEIPLLNEVRLLSIQRSDGEFWNCLQIPFLTLDNNESKRTVLSVFIFNDAVIKSELDDAMEASTPAP